ncbi:MAG: hypothetical protein ACWGPS_09230 [Candidatus Promineifilaceae bacterium]
MCCIFTILLFLGPRFAGIVWWLASPARWVGTLGAFNSAIWPILGLIFLPWTTLMFVLVAPGGIVGWDFLWLGLAILGDVAMYGGGGYGNRDRVFG